MEHMAAKLNLDPSEFRKINFIKEGDMTLHGHPYHGDNPLPNLMADLEKSSNFTARKAEVEAYNKANKWKKRGINMLPCLYNVAGMVPMPFYCTVNIYQGDGSVSVGHGGIEMGQGLNTKVAQTVAKTLGIPMEMVQIKPSDVMVAPNNCVTGGSTTSEMCCYVSFFLDFLFIFRGEKILEQLSRPRFFPGFEISCSFLCAKQVREKGGKFQKPEKIVFLKVVLIFFSL